MLPFHHPFTSIVSGPTGCGKTNFVLKLVDHANELIEPVPAKFVYYFAEYQPQFKIYEKRIEFRRGKPEAGELETLRDVLVVVDDLMTETDEELANLFTRGSHHRNVSVIFLLQNFFLRNKYMRTISLNAQYIVLFKNPRDNSQFVHLAKQLYPRKSAYAIEAYTDATLQPYGYLLLDLRNEQDEDLRLRTYIFPGERQIVYVPDTIKRSSEQNLIKYSQNESTVTRVTSAA